MRKTSFKEDRPAPGYWMNETSGRLRPVIEAYLNGNAMTSHQIAVMRGYLIQWIDAAWVCKPGAQLEWLGEHVFNIDSRDKIEAWLRRAYDIGIDPL